MQTANQIRYQKHKESYKAYREANKPRMQELQREWYARNRERELARMKAKNANVRIEVLTHYSAGTLVCGCCGYSGINFLSIEHDNGGGTQHRKKIGTGNAIFHWLKRNSFPSGYSVLCHNCNFSKGIYGFCHEKELLK